MRQKIIIFFALFLLIRVSVCAQSSEVKFIIDTTISIMKNNAVNANTVDWDTLRSNALLRLPFPNIALEMVPLFPFEELSVSVVPVDSSRW